MNSVHSAVQTSKLDLFTASRYKSKNLFGVSEKNGPAMATTFSHGPCATMFEGGWSVLFT